MKDSTPARLDPHAEPLHLRVVLDELGARGFSWLTAWAVILIGICPSPGSTLGPQIIGIRWQERGPECQRVSSKQQESQRVGAENPRSQHPLLKTSNLGGCRFEPCRARQPA